MSMDIYFSFKDYLNTYSNKKEFRVIDMKCIETYLDISIDITLPLIVMNLPTNQLKNYNEYKSIMH